MHQHWTDPDVRRYLWDGEAIALQQVEDLVAQSEQLFAEQSYGLWALRLQKQAGLLGCAGYWLFHEPPQLELVISLSPRWWGQGLAAEASAALLAYGFDKLGMEEIRASTDAPNLALHRLIERLGLRFSHRTDAEGLDTVFYALRADEFKPPAPHPA